MGLYEELSAVDVMDVIADKLTNRRMELDPNTGRLVLQNKSILPKPWILSGIDYYRQCSIWKDFIFDTFRVLHPGCRACWKICYRPPTLEKLFATYGLQQKMSKQNIPGTDIKYHSKCGVERRPYSGNQGGYAAFWYNPLCSNLDTARAIQEDVLNRVTNEIDKTATVILKRGCTEMEMTYPPSDSWDELAEKNEWDKKLRLIETIAPDYSKPDVEDYLISVIHSQKIWIEHAAQYGDMTYLKYTDRQIHPNLLNYAGSIHNAKDYATHDHKCAMYHNEPPYAEPEREDNNRIETIDE